MRMRLLTFDLPLRHVFTISRGSTEVSRTVIVELEADGALGYGEAGESSYYGASVPNIVAALEAMRPLVESAALHQPERLYDQWAPHLAANRFALCALDMAVNDLWGKLRGQPLWKLWGLNPDRCPPTDYTLGIDTLDKMLAKMDEFPNWPIYKIKLGTPDDLAVVRALREHTSAIFRVDANAAWQPEQAVALSRELAQLNVELIEQPLPPENIEGQRRVFAASALPLVADESCRTEEDVPRCAGLFHGINVKLVKCGGLTPARRMLQQARQLGLKTMVGCMTESTVGISAIAQLAPMLDYVDMDGALLLAEDIAEGVRIEQGRIILPTEPGCGVRLVNPPNDCM